MGGFPPPNCDVSRSKLISVLAVDLLYQLSIHRDCCHTCSIDVEVGPQAIQTWRAVAPRRLGWVRSFHRVLSQLSHSNHLGMLRSVWQWNIVVTKFQGGVSYAWDSWRTLVPLIIGVVGLIFFVIFEEHFAKEPLIRMDVFKNRTSAASYFETTIHGMILWCILYYLPLYYEAVKGETPILAGISLFPETFTVAPAAMVTGILISKTGRYRWALWSGWFLTTLGSGLLVLLTPDTSTVAWIFLNLVSGLGMGMLFPSMAFSIQAATTNKDLAFAVALYSFFRAFGQAIGVAIGGTIFQNEMKKKLLTYPLLASKAGEYSADASSLVQIIKTMEAGAAKTQLIQSYSDALQIVWAVMTGLAFLGLLSSFLIKGLDLNRALETEQGLQRQKTREQKDVEEK